MKLPWLVMEDIGLLTASLQHTVNGKDIMKSSQTYNKLKNTYI